MSSFQHLWSRSSCSRVHQAACFGSVNFCFPVVASRTSLIELMPCAPMIEYSQPPNQPSLMPPAMGVIPLAFSASQAFSSAAHVVGTFDAGLREDVLAVEDGERGLDVPRRGPDLPGVRVLLRVQVVRSSDFGM